MDKANYILCCQNIGVFDLKSFSHTRLFVICSTRWGCGKSTFSDYLGEILRREGRHVVWMDFDASQPKRWLSLFGFGATFAACVELERALTHGHTVIALVDRPLRITADFPIHRNPHPSWGHPLTYRDWLDVPRLAQLGLPPHIARNFAGSLFIFRNKIANPCTSMTELHAHIPSYKSLLAITIELVLRRFHMRAAWDTALTAVIHDHLYSACESVYSRGATAT